MYESASRPPLYVAPVPCVQVRAICVCRRGAIDGRRSLACRRGAITGAMCARSDARR